MDCLLIIDMQSAWINESPRYEIAAVIHRINMMASAYRAQNKPVIFVRHSESSLTQGHQDWDVHPDLVALESDYYVDKTACDPFWQANLQCLLTQVACKTVTVCGMATEFCVDTAVRFLLSAGYSVNVVADAHTTGDRPHLSAPQIILHHNWIWQHMACPHGVAVSLRKAAEICQSLGEV